MTIRTYSLAEVAEQLCGDSMADPQKWVARQIRAGRFPARRVGRHWRMTAADLEAALEAIANRPSRPAAEPAAPGTAVSAAALRRRLAVAQ